MKNAKRGQYPSGALLDRGIHREIYWIAMSQWDNSTRTEYPFTRHY